MVKFEWMCNVCKKVLPDTKELMMHTFFSHPEARLYGTPIPMDVLPIPKRPEPVAAKLRKAVKPRVRRKIIEEPEEPEELEEELGQDLSLD